MRCRASVLAAVLTAGGLLLSGCTGSTPTAAHSPTATPTRSPGHTTTPPPPPSVRLVSAAFLGATYLAPAGWRRSETRNTAADGEVTYTDPAVPYTVYLEVSSCAACVDHGLVTTGRADGLPDPLAVAQQVPAVRSTGLLSPPVAQYTAAGDVPGSVTVGVVRVVFNAGGVITGYLRLEATLPAAQKALATRIARSVR